MAQTFVEKVSRRYHSLLKEVGKRALAIVYPKDFNYYLMTLELVDSDGITVDLFVFPIMPSEISEEKTEITTVKKSAKGITSIKTSTFIPRTINISGDFGRNFKIVVGNEINNSFSSLYLTSTGDGIFTKENLSKNGIKVLESTFSKVIKTGYGCTKILEAIVDKSLGLDAKGKPFNLFLYNPGLGNNYLVNVKSFKLHQDIQSNMIWKYNLTMTAIARLEELDFSDSTSLIEIFAADFINKQGSLLVGKLSKALKF